LGWQVIEKTPSGPGENPKNKKAGLTFVKPAFVINN
jgi:hypothetical protein